MTYAVSVVRDVAASSEKVWALVTDLPRKFVFGLSVKDMDLCDWVYELEPTTDGCRVTHAWVESPQWAEFAPIGKSISGVDDRAAHNLRNMGITLDNLIKAVK